MNPGPSASVVLPVRGEIALLRDALAALAAQTVPVQVVVVDDDPAGDLSLDGSSATVVHSGGRGPYGARNLGSSTASGEVLLFCDVRSRPHPQWVERTLQAFQDPEVAMVGSEVTVVAGRAWGARASAHQQIFRLQKYIARPGYSPYLPNCNLAVRRADLEEVGGYSEVRSGGDADLCWRVLARPGRRLQTLDDVLMDWVPRQGFRSYLSQNYRYGRSHVQLRRQWGGNGAPMPAEPWSTFRLLRRGVRVTGRVLVGVVVRPRLDDALAQAGHLVFQAGVRKESRS